MKKTVIEFIASASPYHAGDIAGFDEAAAKGYIDAKIAKLYKAGGATSNNNKNAGGKSKTDKAPAEPHAPLDAGDAPDQATV